MTKGGWEANHSELCLAFSIFGHGEQHLQYMVDVRSIQKVEQANEKNLRSPLWIIHIEIRHSNSGKMK